MEYIIQDSTLQGIADAIREKTGGTEPIAVNNMATQIEGIVSGGSGGDIDALIDGSITEFSSNVESVSSHAFDTRPNLVSVNLPMAKSLEGSAFSSCNKLRTVSVPLVENLGKNAFYFCSALESLCLPSLRKKTGSDSIGTNLSALTFVDLPNLETVNGQLLASCYALVSVKLPRLVTSSGTSGSDGMFGYCNNLKHLDLPNLTSASRSTFAKLSKITEVILRSTTMCALSDIRTFNDCYHMVGTTHNIHNPDGLHDGYVYVPSALKASYEADSVWSSSTLQFRALEDYTVDGTITGELDPNKI